MHGFQFYKMAEGATGSKQGSNDGSSCMSCEACLVHLWKSSMSMEIFVVFLLLLKSDNFSSCYSAACSPVQIQKFSVGKARTRGPLERASNFVTWSVNREGSVAV